MPVLYKPFQSTLEDKKSGKKLFYPRVVRSGNVDSAQLSKEIAAYSSLSPGDVKNTLDNLVTVMGQHLQSSESVSVDDKLVSDAGSAGGGNSGGSDKPGGGGNEGGGEAPDPAA